ncbi:MAG: Gfo/Idh/MocA family protein [Saccharofermentanales bacterium]
MSSGKKIRVGIIGASRGLSFAGNAEFVGMELVAVCDTWEERLAEAGKKFNVATYTDYDKFLEHDMDAVILANFFHQHAPFAIKALEAGKHVMSETSACKTLAEGVALARAVEKSGKIYMLAENYCYFAYIQEMRRLYLEDEIGDIQFGECEYIHPGDSHFFNMLSPGLNHWRNYLPATYYCTHALGPVMYVTDRRPVSVNARCIPYSDKDKENLIVKQGDIGSSIMCTMDNDSVVLVNGLCMRGHGNWYRIHGTRGRMENLRHEDSQKLRITHESWDMKEGDVPEKIYLPDFPENAKIASQMGHGGGDFFTEYYFAQAIRDNEQPYLDVYRGLDMTLVGIQAYKSSLANGAPFEIPDFRNESVRVLYENDNWSPFPEDKAPGQPPPSIKGLHTPSKEALEYAQKVWDEIGYHGQQ